MNPDRPHVEVSPAVRFGQPTVRGVSVDAIAELVWAEGCLNAAVADYDLAGMTRADVLVACWYSAWYGEKRWRKRWRDWATDHVHHLAAGRYYQVPDPPGAEP